MHSKALKVSGLKINFKQHPGILSPYMYSICSTWSGVEKMASLTVRVEAKVKGQELKHKLEKCWSLMLNWSLYPTHVAEVSKHIGVIQLIFQFTVKCS